MSLTFVNVQDFTSQTYEHADFEIFIEGKTLPLTISFAPLFCVSTEAGLRRQEVKSQAFRGELLPLPLPGQSAEAAAQWRRGKYLPVNTMVLLGLQALLLRSSKATEVVGGKHVQRLHF